MMIKFILRSLLFFVVTLSIRQAIVLNGKISSSVDDNTNCGGQNDDHVVGVVDGEDCSPPPIMITTNTLLKNNATITTSSGSISKSARRILSVDKEQTPTPISPTGPEPTPRPTTAAAPPTVSPTTRRTITESPSAAKSSSSSYPTKKKKKQMTSESPPSNRNKEDATATTAKPPESSSSSSSSSVSYRERLLKEWNGFEKHWNNTLTMKRYMKTLNSQRVPPMKKFQDFIIAPPSAQTTASKRDVVLATHVSLGSDKIDRIKIALKYWQGPISLAVRVLSVQELHSFFDYFEGDDKAQQFLTVHFVFEYHAPYHAQMLEDHNKPKPITITGKNGQKKTYYVKQNKKKSKDGPYAIAYCHNTLRDMALHSPAIPDFVLVVDIDFVVTFGGYSKLLSILNKQPALWNKMQYDNTLLVVPIFQMWHIPEGWNSIVRGEDPRYQNITIQQLKGIPKHIVSKTKTRKTAETKTTTTTTTPFRTSGASRIIKQRPPKQHVRGRRLLEENEVGAAEVSRARASVTKGTSEKARNPTDHRARLLRREQNPNHKSVQKKNQNSPAPLASTLVADFVINLKVQRTDVEASTHVRRVKLSKIYDTKTGSVSYNELVALAIGFVNGPTTTGANNNKPRNGDRAANTGAASPKTAGFQVKLTCTYVDSKTDLRHVMAIHNSKDLHRAIEQVQDQRVLKMTAEVSNGTATTTSTTPRATKTHVFRDGKLHVISDSLSTTTTTATTTATSTNNKKVEGDDGNPFKLQQFQLGDESDLPASREMLQRMYNLQFATDFYYLPSYEPNNLTQYWKFKEGASNATYPIEYMSRYYEPYFVGYKPKLPHYWTGFRGFGGNKQSFVRECLLSGLEMEALYELYLTHLPHPLNYRDTSEALKEWGTKFKPYLQKKYPYQQMPKRLKQRFQKLKSKFSTGWYEVPM